MSLTLDARQRAMLLEMGVRVWNAPAVASLQGDGQTATTSVPTSPVPPASEAAPVSAAHAPARRSPSTTGSTATPSSSEPSSPVSAAATNGWTLQPLRLLYPNTDPAQTPPGLGAGWLVITEAIAPTEPWAEAAGQLLDAMLRALQLHHHPRVALCALAPDAAASPSETTDALAVQVTQFAPSVVLVMGRNAIRAALGTTEPFGKLRTRQLVVAGVPAVATFDAPLLLRNGDSKRAAWADLCRARALAGRATDTPVP